MKMGIYSAKEYSIAFQARDSSISYSVAGLAGRLVRGKSDDDFERLSYAPGRRLAWVSGADALCGMLGVEHRRIILQLGKTEGWLDDKIAGGFRWRLLVFPDQIATLATWDGVFECLGREYFEAFDRIVNRRLEIIRLQPEDWAFECDSDGAKDPCHPDHVSLSRYLQGPDTAVAARRFLWHSLGINQLFAGDGYTRNQSGDRGWMEYLVPNRPVAGIDGLVCCDLRLDDVF